MNEVLKAIAARRSCRKFLPEQVREEHLSAILEAGTWAASGMGAQPVVLVAVQDAETRAQLSRMNAAILGSSGDPFYGAPTVVVVLADPARGTCVEDGSLALGNLMLAASALGVGSCWIHRAREEFASPEGKALLKAWGVPEDYIGVGHCILGYPDGPPARPEAPAGGRRPAGLKDMADLFEQLPAAILPWYDAGHRDLPWRRDREPYHVWLSEIMLQQTRVEAVRGYYARFLAALPDIPALAGADPDALRKLWEGLGYYTRVRNLQRAAQVVMEQYGGRFPTDYAAVRALPGIGDYTAGAICSICFETPVPAVDGNVLRVAARVDDSAAPITDPKVKKAVAARLQAVYPAGRCGDFTQGLMELGATLCGPNGAPQCGACPCRSFCLGRARGTAARLPVKAPKRARRDEEMTVFLLWYGERVAVVRREGRGLLADLWSFPNVPGKLDAQAALDQAAAWGVRPTDVVSVTEKEHIFTHVRWLQRGYTLRCAAEGGPFTWASRARVKAELALPTAFRQFWEGKDGL